MRAAVYDYDYKPRWIRHVSAGEGAQRGLPTLGVELELVFPEEWKYQRYLTLMGAEKLQESQVFLKKDGSLPENRSVEVVFHPHHISRLEKVVSEVLWVASDADVLYQHEKAGIHIHVARPGLNKGAQCAFALFWNALDEEEVITIGGRSDSDYSKRQEMMLTEPYRALWRDPNHYFRVDASRPETLEVRVFASMADTGFIMSRAALVQAVYGYAQAYPLNYTNAQKWRKIYNLASFKKWVYKHEEYSRVWKIL